MVQTFMTNGGPFSIIVDDTAYNYLSNYDQNTAYKIGERGALNSIGSELQATFGFNAAACVLYRNSQSNLISTYERDVRVLLPSAQIRTLECLPEQYSESVFSLVGSSDKYIKLRYQQSNPTNPQQLTMYNYFSTNLTSYSTSMSPFGHMTCHYYYQTNMIDAFFMGFYVFNSDFTKARVITYSNANDSRYLQFSWASIGDVTLTDTLIPFFDDLVPTGDDPMSPGGTSGGGGGTGTFDGTGDAISIPGLPSLSAVDAGFITLFNPTIGQMQALASYMWSGGFDLNTFRKIFADPMDAILGLSIVPVAVPDGGTKVVKVGNISTGVSMTVAASQYIEVDCGSLDVKEYWGAYLDYSPFTKAELYLPYIGTHPISIDDIMGKTVAIKYHIDILSGSCVAFIKCGESVLYTFIGQCSSSIPITGDNWTNVINGALSIAASIGSMVASGGLTAPVQIPGSGASGREISTLQNIGHAITAGSSMAQNVTSMKPEIEKSGSVSGTGGMLAIQTPYLIFTLPNQCLPARQNEFSGYPSFETVLLGTLSGYTEVYSIHLENVPCTEGELAEIESILKSGVLF